MTCARFAPEDLRVGYVRVGDWYGDTDVRDGQWFCKGIALWMRDFSELWRLRGVVCACPLFSVTILGGLVPGMLFSVPAWFCT